MLDELGTLWDGRVFNPPARSDGARRLEAELSRRRHFRLVRVSSDERGVALLPDHRISPGRRWERYWHVADGANGLELRIEGVGFHSCALQRSADGIWRGRLLQPPGMPVELVCEDRDQPVGPNLLERGGNGLSSLFDRVLATDALLPWDCEVARDLVGTLRTLAAFDPELIERLRDEAARSMPGSNRARLIDAALAALADPANRPERGGIEPGHGWLCGRFELGRGYRR